VDIEAPSYLRLYWITTKTGPVDKDVMRFTVSSSLIDEDLYLTPKRRLTMKTTAKIALIMMIALALTVTSGWAEEKMPQSGFLSDYSKLTQDDPLKFLE
jgi:hypothetical protein